ncbi:thiolase domain-containing protein [Candidatus Beckwithbacteria bacterium]|nr:thiolase domain-containing protein [Candidatus Beckwithbacteria bacterium]
MNKVAVCGAYQTQFGELWDQSLTDLMHEAAIGCLADAGATTASVEAVYIGNMLGGNGFGQKHLGAQLAQELGISAPVTRVEGACASGGMAVFQAVQAIASGAIANALVIGVEKMTDADSEQISQAIMAAADQDEYLAGLNFPGLYALIAQAYIAKFGASEADLAQVAVKNHYHGYLNQKAHFQNQISLEQVIKSSKVADPLKVLDCSPISDGAAAVFLAAPSWAKKKQLKNGVYINGSAQAQDSLSLASRQSLTSLSASKQAAKTAYAQAGITAADINCVEVHDCFTIAEIVAMEDLGLYRQGEAYGHITKQETWLGGKQPINTSGGLKACGHPLGATGVKQIVEATTQLRQVAGQRQVDEALVAVTHNVGGTGGTAVVHVLIR